MIDGEFDALDFVGYVRDHWLVVTIACGVAVGLAFGVSKVLPRKYTATASILIRPPGGSDPRAATAVSPVYLESLKAYESFASSDTLFARAIDAVHARDGNRSVPIEILKRRVLKVSKPGSTAMLEIDATLEDPKKAQALALYIAEKTVELSHSLDTRSSDDLTSEFRAQFDAAKARHDRALQALNAFGLAQPIDTLGNEVQETADLKFRLERDLEVARTDLADYTAQNPPDADEAQWLRNHAASTRARVTALELQTRQLADLLAKKTPELEGRKMRRDALEDDEKTAAAALEIANRRLNEMLTTARAIGEQLQIVDPGIVPQQPSSPNTMLNVVAALLVSLVGSVVYLAFRFGHARLAFARRERVYSHSVR
jgi:capsular polysaccharide biosynthesis protein